MVDLLIGTDWLIDWLIDRSIERERVRECDSRDEVKK